MPHNQYIHQRRQGWYVRVTVPPTLRPLLGKSHVVKSLKTRDVETARLRRWGVLAQVNEWFSEVRAEGFRPLDAEHRLSREPSKSNEIAPPNQHAVSSSTPTPAPKASLPRTAPPRPAQKPSSQSPTIAELLELWMSEAGSTFTKQTAVQHKAAVEFFLSTQDETTRVDAVCRRVAGEFVSKALLGSDRKTATINRIISSQSSMWRWAVRRGLASDNPWTGQGVLPNRQSRHEKKRPYQAAELKKLLLADPAEIVGQRYGGALRDLMRLGLMTGARINELCELRRSDVDLDGMTISIREGKTRNAERTIPAHPVVCGIIKQRLGKNGSELLFPELTAGGPDLKRSWYASKRYTTLRRTILGDDRSVDFHSFRRTFATYLEYGSTIDPTVNASVIAELMGHSKQTLALNLYSGGLKVEHLRRAITLLDEVIEPDILKLLG